MSHFLQQGNSIRIFADDDITIGGFLPPNNYIVQTDAAGNLYLEKVDSFELPPKLYGSVNKHTNRIITTFKSRPNTTGVLLSGEKGSGKTMLAKNICNTLLAEGISTVIINECLFGDTFNKFIQSIDQPCVVLIDEFEKVYDLDKQERMLTLLDGTFPTNKLFIITTNDTYRINQHMRNRPGRLFYAINYVGLEDLFIRDYCQDTLNDKSFIDEICKLSMLYSAFNFDMLKAIVEEMNRYNETPAQVLEMLNAIPDDRENNDFDVEVTINGKVLTKYELDDEGYWRGNPMRPSGFTIDRRNPDYSDDDDSPYWLGVEVTFADLVKADSVAGTFEFMTPRNERVKLTRKKKEFYHYQAF